MTVLEQLERGRARIAECWCQKALVRVIGAPNPGGVRYGVCALGGLLSEEAMQYAAAGDGVIATQELKFYTAAQYELAQAARQIWPGQLGRMDDNTVIISVNDGFSTDVSEVLAMYDRAIRNVQTRQRSVAVPATEAELATAGD